MKFRYIVLLLIFFLSIGYLGYLSGWYDLSFNSGTPKKFINKVKVESGMYEQDKKNLVDSLYSLMKSHKESFTNPEYFDSTTLTIDTIIYDSSFHKIALFVIAKNPIYRNPYSDSKLPFYYNANCYLGKRIYDDSSVFYLKNIGPMSFINFDDYDDAAKAIKRGYFKELNTFKEADNSKTFDFNLNDMRFWNSAKGYLRVFTN